MRSVVARPDLLHLLSDERRVRELDGCALIEEADLTLVRHAILLNDGRELHANCPRRLGIRVGRSSDRRFSFLRIAVDIKRLHRWF